MKTIELLVPFEGLMAAVQKYLEEIGLIKEDEFAIYVDLGLEVNGKGFVLVNVDLLEYIEDHGVKSYLEPIESDNTNE